MHLRLNLRSYLVLQYVSSLRSTTDGDLTSKKTAYSPYLRRYCREHFPDPRSRLIEYIWGKVPNYHDSRWEHNDGLHCKRIHYMNELVRISMSMERKKFAGALLIKQKNNGTSGRKNSGNFLCATRNDHIRCLLTENVDGQSDVVSGDLREDGSVHYSQALDTTDTEVRVEYSVAIVV